MIHDPVFAFDSRERWLPVGVEESLKAAHAKLPEGFPQNGTGRIDFPADMEPFKGPVVGYKRTIKGHPLDWTQWWFWSLFNSKQYAGIGQHEGDWEFIQTGHRGDVPILMTCSQHKSGGKREYWTVELRNHRPVVYVALGSHANYFRPPGFDDECDAKRTVTNIEWRDFGPWAHWPGTWGNSTGPGHSPLSPGYQRDRWDTPHRFHANAHDQ